MIRRIVVALVVGLPLVAVGCGGSAQHTTTQVQRTTATSKTVTPTSPPGPEIANVITAGGSLAARITGDGSLSAAAPDGRGGWFIAGSFTRLDGMPERGLAHVLASGALDPAWHGALSSSGKTALVASGDTLFAAGSIGDTDRSRLLALDAATGTPKRSLPTPHGPISALALQGSRLFVATSTTTSARQRSCLGAIDALSGASVSQFRADIRLSPELGCIAALQRAGRWLYVAGAFRSVNGVARPGLARLDAASGALDAAWNPPAAAVPSSIDGLAVGADAVIVAGSHPALSALSLSTGAPVPGWHPPAAFAVPLSVTILADRVLVGGEYRAGSGLALLAGQGGAQLPSWHPRRGRSVEIVSASGSAALVALGHGG